MKKKVFFMSACILMLLTGCFKQSDKKIVAQIENQIEDILTISNDQNIALDYSETARTENAIIEKTNIEVVDIVDGTTAILSIEAIDLPALFDNAYESIDKKENEQTAYDYISYYISDAIANNNYATTTREIEVSLDNGSGDTQIIISEEFIDALYGGFMSYSMPEGVTE